MSILKYHREVKNPKHPQLGKKLNRNQQYSIELNFLVFAIKGAVGTLKARDVLAKPLHSDDRDMAAYLHRRLSRVVMELDSVGKEIAEFNKTKRLLDL